MNIEQRRNFTDFSYLAMAVFAFTVLIVLLSTATNAVVDNPWPQLLFLELFQRPQLQMLAVILTPMPLFSPVLVMLVTSVMPLLLHLYVLVILVKIISHWDLKARVIYSLMGCIPMFGPLATQTIMKSFGEFKD